MKRFLKKIFAGSAEPEIPREQVDFDAVLKQIQEAEERDIPLGRKIHRMEYGSYEIRLDRDITENYRITVFSGMERVYSFTVFAARGDYKILREAYRNAFDFLNGDQHLAGLPDGEALKGFYYGHD